MAEGRRAKYACKVVWREVSWGQRRHLRGLSFSGRYNAAFGRPGALTKDALGRPFGCECGREASDGHRPTGTSTNTVCSNSALRAKVAEVHGMLLRASPVVL